MTKRKKLENNSAEIVGSIDDLLTQILLCLPAKSLIRSGLVSKHWQSLINDPGFRHRFHSKQKHPVLGLFYYSCPVGSDVRNVDYLPLCKSTIMNLDQFSFIIEYSCNGLLLCEDKSHSNRFVCNPTTRQVIYIPKPEYVGEWDSDNPLFTMTLCFDPTKSPYYKIVCVLEIYSVEGQYTNQIQTYSSETGLWSLSIEQMTDRLRHVKGKYWNGGVHWIGDANSLYLNLEDGAVNTFPSPPEASVFYLLMNEHYFGECCDHMHYITFYSLPQLNMYELKRDRSEWFLKYRVDLSSQCRYTGRAFGDPYDSIKVLYVAYGLEEDEPLLVFEIGGKVIGCNLVSNTFKELCLLDGVVISSKGFQYIESLCSV